MSGVEVAGLVLGSLPLLISALEHYNNGIRTAKKFRDCQDLFNDLLRKVRIETKIFQNTCRLLLSGIVAPEEIDDFINSDSRSRWYEPEVEQKLIKRLGDTHSIYMEAIQQLDCILREFTARLRLTPEGKIRLPNESFKRLYKKVRLGLAYGDYVDLIEGIKQHNRVLNQLTSQARELETISTNRAGSCPKFAFIQSHANNLYRILKTGWSCRCVHDVRLRLESRDNSNVKICEAERSVRFRVAFSTELPEIASIPWSEADACIDECIPDTEAGAEEHGDTPDIPLQLGNSRTKQKKSVRIARIMETDTEIHTTPIPSISQSNTIKNLCEVIHQLGKTPKPARIGNLVFSSNLKVIISCPLETQPRPGQIICLGNLLKVSNFKKRAFSTLIGLFLAQELASSVLQLHNTGWLDKFWTHNDIWFPRGEGAQGIKHPFLIAPTSAPKEITPVSRCIRNTTLFSLGILLIELWYARSLQDLYEPQDLDENGAVHPLADFNCATRIVDEELPDNAGSTLAAVVRRCISCPFDRHKCDLKDKGFQKEVFCQIVEVLRREYEHFRSAASS